MLDQVSQSIAIQRHHAGLGTGKERRQDNQDNKDGNEHTNRNVAQTDLAMTKPVLSIRLWAGDCQEMNVHTAKVFGIGSHLAVRSW